MKRCLLIGLLNVTTILFVQGLPSKSIDSSEESGISKWSSDSDEYSSEDRINKGVSVRLPLFIREILVQIYKEKFRVNDLINKTIDTNDDRLLDTEMFVNSTDHTITVSEADNILNNVSGQSHDEHVMQKKLVSFDNATVEVSFTNLYSVPNHEISSEYHTYTRNNDVISKISDEPYSNHSLYAVKDDISDSRINFSVIVANITEFSHLESCCEFGIQQIEGFTNYTASIYNDRYPFSRDHSDVEQMTEPFGVDNIQIFPINSTNKGDDTIARITELADTHASRDTEKSTIVPLYSTNFHLVDEQSYSEIKEAEVNNISADLTHLNNEEAQSSSTSTTDFLMEDPQMFSKFSDTEITFIQVNDTLVQKESDMVNEDVFINEAKTNFLELMKTETANIIVSNNLETVHIETEHTASEITNNSNVYTDNLYYSLSKQFNDIEDNPTEAPNDQHQTDFSKSSPEFEQIQCQFDQRNCKRVANNQHNHEVEFVTTEYGDINNIILNYHLNENKSMKSNKSSVVADNTVKSTLNRYLSSIDKFIEKIKGCVSNLR
ncbi:hypothetical protein GJ496_007140 [Pomphorhynchus laevis]|nr:hypothetical protein GJ496_007140 [Pomphorhynchus laevis]